VSVCFSKHINKYVLDAYIRHLLAAASGEALESTFFLAEDNLVYTLRSSEIGQEAAVCKLSELISCCKEGCERPFFFYPCFEHNPEKVAKFNYAKYKNMIDDFFNNPRSSCNDRYLLNEFQSGFFDSEEVFEEFIRNSSRVINDAYRAFKI